MDQGVVVVIPYYNGSQWIERAIKSVVAQTVPVDDFVIVNDGSKPEERTALGELAKRYPFRIVDKANGGQGSARNAGVAASKSAYISFLDQDDYYLPQHVEDLLAIVPKNDPQLGFVYADCVWADGDGRVVHTNMLKVNPTMHPKVGSVLDVIGADLFILPSASLIKRDAYEAVGGFDEQFTGYEDDDLFMRMFRAGYTNYFLDKTVTVWCRHASSTSWSVKMSQSRLRYFKKLAASFPDDPALGLYYMRDSIVPRFERPVFYDVDRAMREHSPDLPELRRILEEFLEIVQANKTIAPGLKLKLGVEGFLYKNLPGPVVIGLREIAALPGLAKAARWLHRR